VENTVAVIAASAALLGALIGAGAGWASTAYVQRHQDRREKRQRVHASFKRVLLAANIYAALTTPFQRGSGGAWTPEQDMTEEYRRGFYKTLEDLTEGLRTAAVDLTLEGITEPVDKVTEMAAKFDDFRWHRERTRQRTATEEDWQVPHEASQAIAAIREQLQSQLPAILDDILPISRRPRAHNLSFAAIRQAIPQLPKLRR
jgi:hypothetical protein